MFKNSGINEKHKHFRGSPTLKRRALISIAERSVPANFLISFLFLFICWATPIYRRYPDEVMTFGIIIVLLAIVRLALIFFSKKMILKNFALWKTSYMTLTCLAALAWGCFQAASLYYFGLSWTSFLTSLVTLALCAGQMTAFSLHYPLMVAFQSFMLLPTIFVNYIYVWGLQGTAIGTFFTGFYVLILILGRIHFRQYWHATYEEARLAAMINALPGTLTWVDKNMHYLGVNRMQAEFWGLNPKDFNDKKVGFTQKSSEFTRFVREFFKGDKLNMSRILNRNKKTHFIVGQKFNDGQEAVLLGMDVTSQYVMENELHKQREQSLYSAKLASLGELVNYVVEEIEEPIEMLDKGEGDAKAHVEALRRRVRSLKHFSPDEKQDEKINALELIEDLMSLNEIHFSHHNVGLDVKVDRESFAKVKVPCECFHAILNLINNAFDAVEGADERWVKVVGEVKGSKVIISITDSGPGIPDYLEDVVFEPLYSTKENEKSSGVGLSISRQIIETHDGNLTLNTDSKNTQFIVELPAEA